MLPPRYGDVQQSVISSLQVEMELREVDAKFSRLHGVPAGRALDLYGRVTGPPVVPSPEAARTVRPHGARGKAGAANIKCALHCCKACRRLWHPRLLSSRETILVALTQGCLTPSSNRALHPRRAVDVIPG